MKEREASVCICRWIPDANQTPLRVIFGSPPERGDAWRGFRGQRLRASVMTACVLRCCYVRACRVLSVLKCRAKRQTKERMYRAGVRSHYQVYYNNRGLFSLQYGGHTINTGISMSGKCVQCVAWYKLVAWSWIHTPQLKNPMATTLVCVKRSGSSCSGAHYLVILWLTGGKKVKDFLT